MNKGFAYESKILRVMKANHLVSKEFINQESAGCDNTKPDMILNIKGKDINFEVKKDLRSQAGGTSIRYSNGLFEFVKPIKGIEEEIVFNLLKEKEKSILNFLKYNYVEKIPFTTSKFMWKKSVDKGLLKPINSSINCNIDFIENHYLSKDTYYIQIGGQGLYYMTKDILDLGIPKLEGKMKLEIRLTRGGSVLNKQGERVCSASLRAQARITKLVKSSFNLEDPQTIRYLLNS